MPLQFDNKHINLIIVDTIYYAVVGGNPTRISDADTSNQRLRVSYAMTGMLHYVLENISELFEEYRIRSLPFCNDLFYFCIKSNRVYYKLSKYRSSSSWVEQVVKRPSRQFFSTSSIRVCSSGVIIRSSRSTLTKAYILFFLRIRTCSPLSALSKEAARLFL